MGNTQQRMATTSAKMKTSTSMQTTPRTKTSTPHLAHSTTTYYINDKQQQRHCSSQASTQRNETGGGGGCVPATKCFSNNKPTMTFRHRLLHKWRKNILKTSQTHLDDLNTAARVCGSSAASLTARNRSTTDQNLFLIQDNFVEFIESNETNDKDMVDLNVEENQDELTIDSKLLRDVNQKLNAIASNDSINTETEYLDTVEGETNNIKKLTKSPAIFNISQYTNNVAESNHKDTVKDFFNEQPITSSDSYDDSLSESSVGENFEEYEKRHGGGGLGIRKTSRPISNSTTSSVSSLSSISSFTSSHSSLNVQRTMPPPQPPPTTTKICTNRLKNLLPKLKLKLRKTARNATTKLNDDDYDDETRMMNLAPTDAQLYSFKERFEIKEDDPHIDDLESLCFIDETSSYSLSSSSLLFEPLKTNENPSTMPPTHNQQQPSAALKFLNQVNKRLNFYRLKKQAKTLHVLNNNMDSVSNRVSLNEEKENVAIYDDRTIEKIINKENSYFDYNDNNNNNSNGIMIIDDDTNDSNSGSVKIKAQKPNINEVNSIARLKVNAPLASSEHTTPLSRSIDYLNRLDHFKIILNNTNNKNNYNNATRNQHVTSNVSATLPIKKYYRLCNNTSVYNSPNR